MLEKNPCGAKQLGRAEPLRVWGAADTQGCKCTATWAGVRFVVRSSSSASSCGGGGGGGVVGGGSGSSSSSRRSSNSRTL